MSGPALGDLISNHDVALFVEWDNRVLSSRQHLNERSFGHWKEEPIELSTFLGIRTHTLGGLTCDMRHPPTFERRDMSCARRTTKHRLSARRAYKVGKDAQTLIRDASFSNVFLLLHRKIGDKLYHHGEPTPPSPTPQPIEPTHAFKRLLQENNSP